jgi:hypothetical protein
MLIEGRQQSRTPERFLVHVSSVRDPLLSELASVENVSSKGLRLSTESSWELGSRVDVKAIVGELQGRARVMYCTALGPNQFAVGLNLL